MVGSRDIILCCGLGVLYAFISLAGMPLLWGTLLAAEITTILRYAINDRWVFGERRPSWKRFLQYHVANAGGFVIWWISVNALPRLGMHYLVASTIGTGASVFFTMATNFLWVWAKAPKAANIG